MIRFIIVVLIVVLYLVIGIIPEIILWIVGKFNRPLKDHISLTMVQTAFRLILWVAGVKLTIKGKENIPTDRPVLYVGNHRSYFDILIGYTNVVGLTGFVAKKEMEKAPLLSNWMRKLYCLFLDRDNLKEGMKTILQGIDYIKQGISIWIFPEGTRNKNEDETQLLPFKEGSLKMAEKTGCPIIPVAMRGTINIFEKQFPKIRPQHIFVEFGQPIYLKELSKEERKFAGAYTQHIIEHMLKSDF